MAAAVIGHEFAHHTRGHRAEAAARDALIGLAGLIVGLALESKLQHRNPANAGLGQNLAQIGSTLVSRKSTATKSEKRTRLDLNTWFLLDLIDGALGWQRR